MRKLLGSQWVRPASVSIVEKHKMDVYTVRVTSQQNNRVTRSCPESTLVIKLQRED
jgi:hypothetical protein